jgi:hypothetical protein
MPRNARRSQRAMPAAVRRKRPRLPAKPARKSYGRRGPPRTDVDITVCRDGQCPEVNKAAAEFPRVYLDRPRSNCSLGPEHPPTD